ncbi:MAG: hypothetical protein ACE5NL_01115, partial [Candidatus Hydrothermarchaeaceae archaeon]
MHLNIEKKENLALDFFTAALIYFVLAVTLGLLNAAGVTGIFSNSISAHAHGALLGFVTLTIMGAMYQIIPTILGRALHSPALAKKQFWFVNTGIAGMLAGLLAGANYLFILSGTITALASCLFAYIIYRTMAGAKLEITLRFFAAAIAYLIAAVTLGIFMAAGFGELVTLHSHIALLGFVTLTIMGAMYQMFPMLSMRELYSRKIAGATFWTVNAGILGFFFLAFFKEKMALQASGAIVLISVLLFAYNLFMTLHEKVRAPQTGIDLSVKFCVSAILYLILSTAMGLFFTVCHPARNLVAAHAHVALLGFVTLTIMGAMYHLIPMLSWMRKYAERIGEKGVPALEEMFSKPLGKALLYLTNLGILGFLIALVYKNSSFEVLSGALLAL